MDILDKIVEFKRCEIKSRKRLCPISQLKGSAFFNRRMPSFSEALAKPGPSIIGEFKRKSPSAGDINISADPKSVARGYERAGVAAISVLTDKEFFGGDNSDLLQVASISRIPVLRKDFIIDEYQVIESKSIGAGAILLIASILSYNEIKRLSALAYEIGLEVLFEIHCREELEKLDYKIKIIGINNRDLHTFTVSMERSEELIQNLPQQCVKVAESGFHSCKEVLQLSESGFDAFLIGGEFMRSNDPGQSAVEFIKDLKSFRK